MIRRDIICTVVSVADVDWRLICLSNPHVVMGRQGVYMSGIVGICLLTSYHVLGRISGLYHAPKICTDRRPGKSL